MEIDYEALTQIFLTEAESLLGTMEESLVVLEVYPEDEETLFAIFRAAHTLKGSAACLGLVGVPDFAHVVEDILQRMSLRTVAVTHDLVTLLLQSVDALRQMTGFSAGESMLPEHQALLERLNHVAEAAMLPPGEAPAATSTTIASVMANPLPPALAYAPPATAIAPGAPTADGDRSSGNGAGRSKPAAAPKAAPAVKAPARAAGSNPLVADGAEAVACTQYLTFFMGQEEYGIPILHVREILEYDTLTKVPATPPWIRGVMNVRGQAVPVVDLAHKLGMAESEISRWTCIVTVEAEFEGECVAMGVMADRVSQVMELPAADVVRPPAFGAHRQTDYLLGMGRIDKRFVLLLDIDRVLSADEMLSLAAFGDGALAEAMAYLH